jgi:DNA replication protein DnaC
VTEQISPDLKAVLRRLKLSKILDTLPERLTLARQQKMPYQDILLVVLADEAARRDSQSASLRADKAHLDPDFRLERWDPSAKVTFDQTLLNELATLRFLETHHHVVIVGPVGVGKTFPLFLKCSGSSNVGEYGVSGHGCGQKVIGAKFGRGSYSRGL